MTRLTSIAVAAGAVLVLAGCASRPSEEALAQSILAAASAEGSPVALTQEQATCIAREVLASDLSDTTLSGLVEDFDNPQVLETEVDKVSTVVADAAGRCR